MKKIAVWSAGMTVLLSLLAPLASPAEPQAPAAQFTEATVQPREAFALIQKNKDNPQFVVLDVRTPDEFGSGHIDGAINIDYNTGGFKTLVSELDKTRTYLVYCRTGRRSGGATKVMKDLGFVSIVRMKGDIRGWQSEGLPLVK
ncbi:MAG: rhodanese-like domain-containing protein [Syntrophorhabdales bacterium]|jgi:rhodanese-related sulfurtransferase